MKLTKALRYTALFTLIGLITSIFVFYVQQQENKTYSRNLPLMRVTAELQKRVDNAVLQMEKIAAEKNNLTFQQQVAGPLTSARNLLQQVYDGGTTEFGQ